MNFKNFSLLSKCERKLSDSISLRSYNKWLVT